jgi:hypothetical protein
MFHGLLQDGRIRRITACAMVLFALGAAGRARAADVPKVPGKLSLGLLQVTAGEGFTDRQISTIEEVLLTSFEATGRFKVIGRSDINALLGLESKKEALGCDADTACVAQVAGALGVDLVATADVGRLGTKTIIALTVISVHTATVLKRLRRTVVSNDDLVGAMDSMVAEVTAATGGPVTAPPSGPPPAPPSSATTYVAQPSAPTQLPPAPTAFPAFRYGSPDALLRTPDGKPRILHFQLGEGLKAGYTVIAANDQRTVSCPIPLTKNQGCDLGPIEAGDARLALMNGADKVKDINLAVPQDGAMLKLVLVRPGWARGLGITGCVLGGVSALVAIVAFGITSEDATASTTGIVSSLIAAGFFAIGIPMLVAVHSPDFVPLESSDVFVPAPAPAQ